jgi:hypothetical protein
MRVNVVTNAHFIGDNGKSPSGHLFISWVGQQMVGSLTSRLSQSASTHIRLAR